MAIPKLVVPEEPESYHGIEALTMHVGDPIPTPRAPKRYAVRVSPDLARYLLTFNHPNNRNARPRKITGYAGDMSAGRWRFTPESLVFSISGVLQNGQNRLFGVIESGEPQWLMLDFGWPDDIITVIDRAGARTNQDTMHVSGQANSSQVASIVSKAWQYDKVVGLTRTFGGMPTPSSPEALQLVEAEPDAWQEAAKAGSRVYRALDKGASVAAWGTAYYLIARVHPEHAERFFDEIADGSGSPGSSTRVVADWFRRRPASATKTGDDREPIEVIIRAFNSWLTGKAYAHPKQRGFALSRVRSA